MLYYHAKTIDEYYVFKKSSKLNYMWLFTILHKLLYRNTPHFPYCIDLKFLDPKNYRYIRNIIRMF